MNYRYFVVGAACLVAAVGCSDDNSSNPGGSAGSANTAGTAGTKSDPSDAGQGAGGDANDVGGSAGSSTGGGGAGASMGGSGGSGVMAGKACGPDASMNADGILTAYPNIKVTVTPAADFQITSFNFVVEDDGDPRGPKTTFFADLKNVGQGLHCQFLPSVHLDGEELITLVYGPPRHLKIGDTVFTTVDECIGPGDSAVMSGIQRGLTEADLKAAKTLTIEPAPSNQADTMYLAADAPDIVSPEVTMSAEGYALKGTVSYTHAIHNQGIRVYPRDSRKLIVGELLAFPGNLGAHPAGSTSPFETDTTPCTFSDYELYQRWIED